MTPRFNWLQSDAQYRSEELLRKSIPWFIAEEKWNEIRTRAITCLVNERIGYEISDFESSASFRRLNRENLDFLSPDEWDAYRKLATVNVINLICERVNSTYYSDELKKLLAIKKPAQIPSKKWESMRDLIEKRYLARRIDETRLATAAIKLNETKPQEVGQARWDECQETISTIVYDILFSRMINIRLPYAITETPEYLILPKEKQIELQKQAYAATLYTMPNVLTSFEAKAFLEKPRPSWIQDNDYRNIKEIAERTLDNDRQYAVNAQTQACLKRILNGSVLDEKTLSQVDPETQSKLKELEGQISVARKRLDVDADKLSKELKLLTSDKQTIIKQLGILQALFTDPTSIDRIESYDNPFAPGNFYLLKRVSSTLKGVKAK